MYEVFKFFPRIQNKYSPGFVYSIHNKIYYIRDFILFYFLILMNYEYFRKLVHESPYRRLSYPWHDMYYVSKQY